MLDWTDLRGRLEGNPLVDVETFRVGRPLSAEDLDLWEESYDVSLGPELRALYARGDGADVLWIARPEVAFDPARLGLPELSGRVRLLPLEELLDDSEDDPLWRDEADPELRVLDFFGADFPSREAVGLRLREGRFLPAIEHCGHRWGSVPARLGRPFTVERYAAWTSRIAGFRTWPDADASPATREVFLAAVAAVLGPDTAAWIAADLGATS